MSFFSDYSDGIYAEIYTNKGTIVAELNYKEAPLTVLNFIGLAEGTLNFYTGKPFYNSLTFHRVEPKFVIQAGCPLGNGTGGPGYNIPNEISILKHDRPGTLSMANAGPDTNGSQFFITHVATPYLDGSYSVFGYVVNGMEIVNSIKKNDVINDIKIIKIGADANNFNVCVKDFLKRINLHHNPNNNELNLKKYLSLKDAYIKIYPDLLEDEYGLFYSIIDKGTEKINLANNQIITIKQSIYDAFSGSPFKSFDSDVVNIKINDLEIILQLILNQMLLGERRIILVPEHMFSYFIRFDKPSYSTLLLDLKILNVA